MRRVESAASSLDSQTSVPTQLANLATLSSSLRGFYARPIAVFCPTTAARGVGSENLLCLKTQPCHAGTWH